VGAQPLVDALGVENVIALGDQTQRFGVLELAQTHRAFQRFFSDFVDLNLGVFEDWECLDHSWVKPTRGPPGACGSERANGGGRGIGAVAYVDGEKSHEEKRGDKYDYDYGYGGAELVEVCVGEVIGLGLGLRDGDGD